MVVEADGEIEDVLAALGFGLDEDFFDLGHFLVERLAGIGDGLGARITLEALVDGVDLLAEIADLVDGVIGLRDLFADLDEQIELFLQIGLGHFEAGIRLDLQRSGVRFAQNCEAYLVGARKRFGAFGASTPERSVRNGAGAFVAKIPDEAIQAGFGREWASVVAARTFIFFLRGFVFAFFLFGKVADHLA